MRPRGAAGLLGAVGAALLRVRAARHPEPAVVIGGRQVLALAVRVREPSARGECAGGGRRANQEQDREQTPETKRRPHILGVRRKTEYIISLGERCGRFILLARLCQERGLVP